MRIAEIADAIEREGRAAVVMVAEARGSAPREAGAAMLVTAGASRGTVGGGTVEHRAIVEARQMLRGDAPGAPPQGERSDRAVIRDYPLGPDLDQCCGGHMRLAFAVFGEADLPALREARGRLALWHGGPELIEEPDPRSVLIYGAGHVGTALVRALAPLPFRIRWIDARIDAFPGDLPPGVETVATPLPEAEAKAAAPDALHVVLTHSHALDLEIVAAVLERGDFGFLGLIGSATKKALFLKRMRERGLTGDRLARLTCPIGLPGIRDKRPAVIAAGVAAQLLQVCAEGAVHVSRKSA
jgi:xanthine dehydrogenase accessory factor